jgi:hypothetical protein
VENLGQGMTDLSHPARMLAGAALLQSPLLREPREVRVLRVGEWRGHGAGLPIGSPFRGRVPLISPLLFGGK